jgi:hypothetical protein
MSFRKHLLVAFSSLLVLPYAAPQTSISSVAATAPTAVPPLIPYTATAISPEGKPLTGELSIAFLLFKDEQGGEPLWTETQSVVPDALGRYKVQLGASSSLGIPSDVFASGEGRWLEVQIAGHDPEPRVLLTSVPYAMKASDAATLGGFPASAFVRANVGSMTNVPVEGTQSSGTVSNVTSTVTTTGGTTGYLPRFSGSNTIVNSEIFDTGSSIGIGRQPNPAAILDVNGASILRGVVTLSRTGDATTSAGTNSFGFGFYTQAYNSATKALVAPNFLWQAEVNGNNTTSPGATMNLLYSNGTASLSETGLFINHDGTFHFASGQTFPGTGAGTITRVTAGTALTGGGTSGNVTLNVDTTKVPLLAANNQFTGNQTFAGNLTASDTISGGIINAASSFDLGGLPFAFALGTASSQSVYLGFSGNSTTTGGFNTATGFQAFTSNTTGYDNTASGYRALHSNTTGNANVASGAFALYYNTEGINNVAIGTSALYLNTTGYDNFASGLYALTANTTGIYNIAVGTDALVQNTTGSGNIGMGVEAGYTVDQSAGTGSYNTAIGHSAVFGTGSITNATAIGAYAEAAQSNTMILGCIAGKNSCPATVSVGIGTTTPDNLLTVNGTADKPGGGSWGTFSDGRLKTVDGSFGSGLAQVLQIHPIRYRYKPENDLGIRDAEEHIGVVAQDVQRVIPEAVTKNNKGYLLVNNDPIIWSMVNAIKEQQREIKRQQRLLRAQSLAMRNLEAEVREARRTLRRSEAEVATAQSTIVAVRSTPSTLGVKEKLLVGEK